MDQSHTRRGQPCWFRRAGVGNIAINDSFMLEAAIYHLLKAYFRQDACYVDLVDVFHETTYQTEMGQLLDLITAPEDSVDLDKFSMEKHGLIVRYKTAYYSFYLPVALAMYFCGVPETEGDGGKPYEVAKSILIPVGEYFQIQDDFLDFAAEPGVLGKVGTDIVDNKCSWCINTALSLANASQRAILYDNYGQKDAVKEAKVKEVFEAVGLRGVYAAYEEQVYVRITCDIKEKVRSGSGLKREVFTRFVEKIYRRRK
jgi:farnesyl diphosphate synthase